MLFRYFQPKVCTDKLPVRNHRSGDLRHAGRCESQLVADLGHLHSRLSAKKFQDFSLSLPRWLTKYYSCGFFSTVEVHRPIIILSPGLHIRHQGFDASVFLHCGFKLRQALLKTAQKILPLLKEARVVWFSRFWTRISHKMKLSVARGNRYVDLLAVQMLVLGIDQQCP